MDGSRGARRRLFVGVPLPEDMVPFAVGAQGLLPCGPGMRLLRQDQLHLTLAFIGDADEGKTAAARSVVVSVPGESGGEAFFDGFLLLPTASSARVVALRVADEFGAFARLYGLVMSGLEAAGVMKREKRPFRAHVTVARVRCPGPVQPTSDCGRARFAVESVCLYESELKREGAKYTVLTRTALRRANDQETA
jgi:2'-5' RNA ligase